MPNFYPLLFVIHETNVDIETSLMLHNDPQYYGSYHAVIDRPGTIHYLVPAESKAFAAAESVFHNLTTGEDEAINGSVDDFAYHVALETPVDGIKFNYSTHTGYTIQQYNTLAWLAHSTGVQRERIITHGQIREPEIIEPRCFNMDYFMEIYNAAKYKARKRFDFGVLDLDE